MIVQQFFSVPNVAEHGFLMLLVIGYLVNEIINFIDINLGHNNESADNNIFEGDFINLNFDEFMLKEKQADEKR